MLLQLGVYIATSFCEANKLNRKLKGWQEGERAERARYRVGSWDSKKKKKRLIDSGGRKERKRQEDEAGQNSVQFSSVQLQAEVMPSPYYPSVFLKKKKKKTGRKLTTWPRGQRFGHAIPRSRVRVLLWLLARFVLGCPEFKSSATLVNGHQVASCQLGLLMLLFSIQVIGF